MAPTKTLSPPSYILNVRFLNNHIVPCKTEVNKLGTSPLSFKQYRRLSLCEVLMLDMTEKFANCDKFKEKHKRLVTKQQKNLDVSAKLRAPVSKACLAK